MSEGSVSIVVDTVQFAPASVRDAAASSRVRKSTGGGRSQKGRDLQGRRSVTQRHSVANPSQSDTSVAPARRTRLAAVSVPAGQERAAAERIRTHAGTAATEVFVLMREVARRTSGTWTTERAIAYPGCVFVATGDAEALQERLAAPGLRGAHLIESNSAVSFLSDEEAAFVYDLGGADHVIRMSVGDIVAGRLVVRSGSLVGHEGLVARVDRHRRSAWLAADAPARGLRVGLEVMSKS